MYNLIISRHTFLHNKWDTNIGITRPRLLAKCIRACLIVIGTRACSLMNGILCLHENGILAFPLTNGILRLEENGIRARLLVNGVRALLLASGIRTRLLTDGIQVRLIDIPAYLLMKGFRARILVNGTRACLLASSIRAGAVLPNHPILLMPSVSAIKVSDREGN